MPLTPPVFAHARETAVLVAGAGKARTLRDVLEGPLVPDRYPIQCLRDSTGAVTWFVDAPAASALTREAHAGAEGDSQPASGID